MSALPPVRWSTETKQFLGYDEKEGLKISEKEISRPKTKKNRRFKINAQKPLAESFPMWRIDTERPSKHSEGDSVYVGIAHDGKKKTYRITMEHMPGWTMLCGEDSDTTIDCSSPDNVERVSTMTLSVDLKKAELAICVAGEWHRTAIDIDDIGEWYPCVELASSEEDVKVSLVDLPASSVHPENPKVWKRPQILPLYNATPIMKT
jgi:hypothetical protein